jgi:UDP-N-acetylmuramate: L-alanyl-gamma-D-glutamyl-meso-diaminopimelate ligase
LAAADGVAIGPVNRAQQLADDDRLSPEAVAEALRKRGREAKAFASNAEIPDYLAGAVKPGDLVLVMSNGSFDGLCGKLLEKLKAPAGIRV